MSKMNLSVEHGRTLDEARSCLDAAVVAIRARFGPLIRRVEWSADRNAVTLSGLGFVVDMAVDARHAHVSGDVPLLGGLLQSPLASGVKQIVGQAFRRRLKS